MGLSVMKMHQRRNVINLHAPIRDRRTRAECSNPTTTGDDDDASAVASEKCSC